MRKVFITMLVCLFSLGIASTAGATVLAPGGFGTITGAGLPSGSVFQFGTVVPFSFPTLSGSLTQDVYLNSTGYLFQYRLTSAGSTDAIGRMTLTDFTGFYTEVDGYLVAAGDDMPHSSNRSLSGGTIGFEFINSGAGDSGLAPGKSSYALWVQTDAKYIGAGQAHLINGGTHDLNVYGPAIPEPGTMLLLGMGIFGLFGLRRKKIA